MSEIFDIPDDRTYSSAIAAKLDATLVEAIELAEESDEDMAVWLEMLQAAHYQRTRE